MVGALPKALNQQGIEVAIIIPKYKVPGATFPETLPGSEVPVFYVENDLYFGDGNVYPGGEAEHARFAYFSRAVVDFLDTRAFEPEVIHCHDYHASLIPNLLKERRRKVATVLTIHDLSNEGVSDPSILDTSLLGNSTLRVLDWDLADRNVDLLLQGIVAADVINTVSPTYAREILTAARGEGLEEVLQAREGRVFGILNGIDRQEYDPATDKNLVVRFPSPPPSGGGPSSAEKAYLEAVLTAKKANRQALCERLGLKVKEGLPLVSLISRLVERKGLGLVLAVLDDLAGRGIPVVVLGRGEPRFEEALRQFSQKYPHLVSAQIRFDEALARLIYAGSDLFLVPSVFEPCGLTQMIALRYGTVPVVHATGGLSDTVEEGLTGFTFKPHRLDAFQQALNSALEAFEKGELVKLVANGLKKDFGWEKAASRYIKLYEKALGYKFGISRGVGGEIRRDSFGEWTILSTIRQQRPDETGAVRTQNSELRIQNQRLETHSKKGELEKCPFEEGHEAMSGDEVFRTGEGTENRPGWSTRVVPNKYPILPAHEVIVHSPNHEKDIENFDQGQMENLVWTYLSRYRHYEDYGYIHLFCNRGREAAASLRHPHSQLIVLDELTRSTVEALGTAEEFYRQFGICPYCDLIKKEATGPRLVWQNDSMVLLTPFSSDWPYELSLFPKTHRKSFGNISEKEMKDFARTLQTAIKLLSEEIEQLSYNFWIHSLPALLGLEKSSLYYHWHLDLVPRVKVLGGIELGLKLMIDDRISPEDAAARLRSHLT